MSGKGQESVKISALLQLEGQSLQYFVQEATDIGAYFLLVFAEVHGGSWGYTSTLRSSDCSIMASFKAPPFFRL